MTDAITEFITARLDEDEARAQAAIDPEVIEVAWFDQGTRRTRPAQDTGEWRTTSVDDRGTDVLMSGIPGARVVFGAEGDVPSPGQADHIARHDPARVLREVAAKRAILALHPPDELDGTEWCTACWSDDRHESEWLWPCATVRALVAPYVDLLGPDRAVLHEVTRRLASDTGDRHSLDEVIEALGFTREELEAEIDREEADQIAPDMSLEGKPLTDEARAAVLRRVVAERTQRSRGQEDPDG